MKRAKVIDPNYKDNTDPNIISLIKYGETYWIIDVKEYYNAKGELGIWYLLNKDKDAFGGCYLGPSQIEIING